MFCKPPVTDKLKSVNKFSRYIGHTKTDSQTRRNEELQQLFASSKEYARVPKLPLKVKGIQTEKHLNQILHLQLEYTICSVVCHKLLKTLLNHKSFQHIGHVRVQLLKKNTFQQSL